MNMIEYGYIPDGEPSRDGEIPARVTAVYKDRYEIVCSFGTGQATLKKAHILQGKNPSPPPVILS